jgi:hypothetical protein
MKYLCVRGVGRKAYRRLLAIGYTVVMSFSSEPEEKVGAGALPDWEAVETFKAQELAAMTEERALRIIQSLRLFAPVPPNPLNGMGLVEQQAIFHRLKP